MNASVDTSQVTDDLLDIFVEYHWLLSKFSVRDANQFLYEERKKREFVSTIESVAPSGPSRRNSGNSAGQAGSDRNKSDAADPEDASFSLSFTSTSTAVTTSSTWASLFFLCTPKLSACLKKHPHLINPARLQWEPWPPKRRQPKGRRTNHLFTRGYNRGGLRLTARRCRVWPLRRPLAR